METFLERTTPKRSLRGVPGRVGMELIKLMMRFEKYRSCESSGGALAVVCTVSIGDGQRGETMQQDHVLLMHSAGAKPSMRRSLSQAPSRQWPGFPPSPRSNHQRQELFCHLLIRGLAPAQRGAERRYVEGK